ncbi:MAG: hypothetical protein C0625_08425 [Arcobacter sp.]|nr:MAG: hypothetical protein C0625_08425 [Arcobacter sp.]
MKNLLTLLALSYTFLNAETIYNGKCIDSYYTGNNTTIYYYRSATPTTLRTMTESKAKIDELRENTNKFYFDKNTNNCIAIMEDNTSLFMDSLIGILIGFSILFFSIFLTIKVGSKK